jgi:hypothetical protein
MELQREQLVEQLKTSICEVTFTKVNGEKRVMPCTLREDLMPTIPADVGSKSTVKRHVVQNVLSVWCTDASAWRSFRIDSVTDMKVLLR